MASDVAAPALRDLLRMEKLIARCRCAVALLTGVVLLFWLPGGTATGRFPTLAAWGVAVVYAVAVLLAAPYRRIPSALWQIVSGCVDWGFITLAIVATGMERSELWVLYLFTLLVVALRHGPREVVIAGSGIVAAYFGLIFASAANWSTAAPSAWTHGGYILLFALGSGVLAREAKQRLRARLEGEARLRAVTEVTGTISHDLRSPLAAITGLVEILLNAAPETLSFDQRALLHRINANVQQMNNLVSNFLDAALLEGGKLTFLPAPVDLNRVVRQVVEGQAHQAEVKQIGLVLDLSSSLPVAKLDTTMIERLVANVLHNAIAFTPPNGAIRVSTRRRDAHVAIEVWNSGPHVPPGLRATMFEKFVRDGDSHGAGLGLYICKSIVNLHGGTIAAHNVAGGGVTVIAELPMLLPGPHARPPTPVPTWQASLG